MSGSPLFLGVLLSCLHLLSSLRGFPRVPESLGHQLVLLGEVSLSRAAALSTAQL